MKVRNTFSSCSSCASAVAAADFQHFSKSISVFRSCFSFSPPLFFCLRMLWLIFLIIYHLSTTIPGGGPYFSSNVNGISDKRVRLLPIDVYCFSQMKNKLFLWFILNEMVKENAKEGENHSNKFSREKEIKLKQKNREEKKTHKFRVFLINTVQPLLSGGYGTSTVSDNQFSWT